MSFPGHSERLVQTHVQTEVAGITDRVAIARFTWLRITEALVNRCWIRKEVRLTLDVTKVRFNRTNAHHARRDLPVSGPTLEGEWTRRGSRQTGVPTEDSGQVPTTEDSIRESSGVSKQLLATTKRQTNDPVRRDVVANVEIRIRIVQLGTQRVEDQRRGREVKCVLKTRSVIERVRKRVVEVENDVV